MKHTEGNWKVLKDSGELYVTAENDKQSICKLPIKYSCSDANAKLIASAPELLEACVNALGTYEKHGTLLNFDVNILREAIKKATE